MKYVATFKEGVRVPAQFAPIYDAYLEVIRIENYVAVCKAPTDDKYGYITWHIPVQHLNFEKE